MAKTYYLETSAIRSRLIGHSEIYKVLVDKLKDRTRITSKFVQSEFNRGFMRHLIAFYFNLQDSKKISDALKWWSETYKIRELKDINYIFAEVFLGIEDNNIKLAVFKLRQQIRLLFDNFQFLIHRFEKNDVDCSFQHAVIDFDAHDTIEDLEAEMVWFYQAFRDDHAADCKIVQLFDKSKKALNNLIKYSSKEKGYKKQVVRLIKIENKELSLSCSTCSKIGDTIIALECPDYAVLLTHDGAFQDLCKVLGFKCEILPPLRTVRPSSKALGRLTNP